MAIEIIGKVRGIFSSKRPNMMKYCAAEEFSYSGWIFRNRTLSPIWRSPHFRVKDGWSEPKGGSSFKRNPENRASCEEPLRWPSGCRIFIYQTNRWLWAVRYTPLCSLPSSNFKLCTPALFNVIRVIQGIFTAWLSIFPSSTCQLERSGSAVSVLEGAQEFRWQELFSF